MAVAIGNDAKFFVKTEAAYDVAQAFSATDAVGFTELSFEPFLNFEKSKERTGSASLQDEAEAKRGGKWKGTVEVKPNAAGVAPDCGELLKAAYGTETVSADTSVTYELLGSGTPASLQLARHAGDDFYEVVTGAIVEQVEFEIQGGQIAKIMFSGSYATHGYAYGATTGGSTYSSSATSIALASTSAYRIAKNARVKFGTEDNSGSGYLVTAVSADGLTLTISPGLANGISASQAVKAVSPAMTVGGTVIGSIACGFSVDGTAIGLISGKATFKTGNHLLDKEASSDRPTGTARGDREITGEVQVYYKSTENARYLGAAWAGAVRALILRAGADTAAKRMKLNFPAARLEVVPVEVPEAEEAMATMKFVARQDAASNDEHTLLWD